MELEPILAAIRSGDAEAVDLMLAEQPELANARDESGTSLIMTACYYRKPDIVAVFATCGATLDIFEAAASGDEHRVRLLAEHFPESVSAYSPDGFFPLALAAYLGHPKIVEFLLSAGADVNQVAENPFKITALHSAVSNQDLAAAELLIAHGADVNARQQEGFTPLQGAAANGNTALIDLLLAHGADAAALNDQGKSAADLAEARYPEIAGRLRSLR